MPNETEELAKRVSDAVEEYAICQARAIMHAHEAMKHPDIYRMYDDEHNRVRLAGAKADLRLRIAEMMARAGAGMQTLTGPPINIQEIAGHSVAVQSRAHIPEGAGSTPAPANDELGKAH